MTGNRNINLNNYAITKVNRNIRFLFLSSGFFQIVLNIKNEGKCRIPMNNFVKLLYGYAIIDSGKATMPGKFKL